MKQYQYQEVKYKFPLNTVLIFNKLCCYSHEDLIYIFPKDKLSLLKPNTFLWLDDLNRISLYKIPIYLWDSDIKTYKDLIKFIEKNKEN